MKTVYIGLVYDSFGYLGSAGMLENIEHCSLTKKQAAIDAAQALYSYYITGSSEITYRLLAIEVVSEAEREDFYSGLTKSEIKAIQDMVNNNATGISSENEKVIEDILLHNDSIITEITVDTYEELSDCYTVMEYLNNRLNQPFVDTSIPVEDIDLVDVVFETPAFEQYTKDMVAHMVGKTLGVSISGLVSAAWPGSTQMLRFNY